MNVFERLRPPEIGPFRTGAFRSEHHNERNAATLGVALGVCFTICFATGLYSHALQTPPSWFTAFPRPAGLYRFTQGLHIATGIASIPLLVAKLWTVYPKLFTWPPFSGVAQALERLMLLPLVGGALFLVVSGVNNINLNYRWYVFNFRPGHYRAAWITVGALIVHIGAKVSTTRRVLGRSRASDTPQPSSIASPDRRGFLGAVFGTSALVTVFTVGQTFRPFRTLALLAPRRPDVGPQGFPVNRTAVEAGTANVDIDAYRLTIEGPGVRRALSLRYDELLAMPQRSAELPIACVEGWSASRQWRGVPVRHLLDLAGVPHDTHVTVASLQRHGAYSTSELTGSVTDDADTLLALTVDGAPLHPDHGYPVRLIAPNRPGVLQTKWVHKVSVR